jgi:hypothetical protein
MRTHTIIDMARPANMCVRGAARYEVGRGPVNVVNGAGTQHFIFRDPDARCCPAPALSCGSGGWLLCIEEDIHPVFDPFGSSVKESECPIDPGNASGRSPPTPPRFSGRDGSRAKGGRSGIAECIILGRAADSHTFWRIPPGHAQ